MSKVYTYMVTFVGIIILMKIGGLPTSVDWVLIKLGISTTTASGVSLGAFFGGIIAILATGLIGGIAISFLTKSPSESYIIAPVAAMIFTLITGSMVSIISYTQDMEWVYYIIFLMLIPLLIGFGIAIIQFWRGTD